MKITKITLNNLASIEGLVEIDFTKEPLSSAGIFAISGPTGSGKSTILDALCLALYDKTPRFEATSEKLKLQDVGEATIGQDDVRNILRRGSGSGYAIVEFIAVDGLTYRSKWSVRRAHNSATGSLQPQVIEVYNIDHDSDLQGTKTEVLSQLERLIGLSYTQFTRTVLLAQNDFATFLKSKESAKAELLEKLTGTEVYSEISREIYLRNKEEQNGLSDLNLLMDNTKVFTTEELVELEKEQTTLMKSVEEQKKLQLKLNKTKEDYAKHREVTGYINNKNKELILLNKQLVDKNQEVESHIKAVELFTAKSKAIEPEIDQAREYDVLLKSSKEQLELRNKKVGELEELFTKAQNEWLKANKEFVVLENELISFASELSATLGKELTYGDLLKELTIDRNQLEKSQERVENLLTSLDKEALDKQQKINSERKDQLQQLTTAFRDKQRLTKEVVELEEFLKRQTHKLTEYTRESERLTPLIKEKSIAYNELSKSYDKVRIQLSENITDLRNSLVQGEACPLCGSTSHEVENIYAKSALSVIKKQLDELKAEVDELNKLLTASVTNINNTNTQLTENNRTLGVKRKELETLLGQFEKEKFELEYITKFKEELEKSDRENTAQLALYEKERVERDRIIKNLNQVRSNQDSIKEKLVQLTEKKTASDYFKKDLEKISKEYSAEKKIRETEQEKYKNLQTERAKLLKGMSIEEARAKIVLKAEEYKATEAKLQKERNKINESISSVNGELTQLNSNLKLLDKDLEGSLLEKDLLVELDKQVTELKAKEESLATLKAKLFQNKSNQKRLGDLKKSYEQKQKIAESWAKLNSLIGSATGNAFKVIAQRYTLEILLLHANKQLSLLSKRYRVQQVPDSLALQVIDCDMCDEVRTVYSLSGGESFLISLALALGLSSLSSNNLKVESLFIDEGFGSLDSESLRTAMEALEQLQHQGRQIGVISHVQEMSERIAVQVKLEKGASGRSSLAIIG